MLYIQIVSSSTATQMLQCSPGQLRNHYLTKSMAMGTVSNYPLPNANNCNATSILQLQDTVRIAVCNSGKTAVQDCNSYSYIGDEFRAHLVYPLSSDHEAIIVLSCFSLSCNELSRSLMHPPHARNNPDSTYALTSDTCQHEAIHVCVE
jgi:hypothetical protein